jgi:hypothetical protein
MEGSGDSIGWTTMEVAAVAACEAAPVSGGSGLSAVSWEETSAAAVGAAAAARPSPLLPEVCEQDWVPGWEAGPELAPGMSMLPRDARRWLSAGMGVREAMPAARAPIGWKGGAAPVDAESELRSGLLPPLPCCWYWEPSDWRKT